MSDRNEILIQRCVDNELSSPERHEMIARLEDAPDGWKSLACCFMEEQLYAAVTETDKPVSTPVRQTSTKSRHWFHHPMMSLALSACVAFLLGVLVRGPGENLAADVAGLSGVTSTDEGPESVSDPGLADGDDRPSPAAGLVSNDGYRVRLMSDGKTAGELPVYSLEDYVRRSQKHFKESGTTSGGQGGAERRIRTIWLSAPDGHTYVIPVEEITRLPKLQ